MSYWVSTSAITLVLACIVASVSASAPACPGEASLVAQCKTADLCATGTLVPGLCTSPLVCCVHGDTSKCPGECVAASHCRGGGAPGLCPGTNNIVCCMDNFRKHIQDMKGCPDPEGLQVMGQQTDPESKSAGQLARWARSTSLGRLYSKTYNLPNRCDEFNMAARDVLLEMSAEDNPAFGAEELLDDLPEGHVEHHDAYPADMDHVLMH
eukprot:TRINITY_DN3462_c0_g1_i1.p1 TRINITY_DN3462_c0_g1~~TRINITY_DN3462_c0_g1_i1.p1  ORF type:complete len:210 (+),score=22.10 TRINITY_DN3462_c0_g1_i1:90-719(+)